MPGKFFSLLGRSEPVSFTGSTISPDSAKAFQDALAELSGKGCCTITVAVIRWE